MTSCVACCAPTSRPREMREGPMCPRCARFMRIALDDLEPLPERPIALDDLIGVAS